MSMLAWFLTDITVDAVKKNGGCLVTFIQILILLVFLSPIAILSYFFKEHEIAKGSEDDLALAIFFGIIAFFAFIVHLISLYRKCNSNKIAIEKIEANTYWRCAKLFAVCFILLTPMAFAVYSESFLQTPTYPFSRETFLILSLVCILFAIVPFWRLAFCFVKIFNYQTCCLFLKFLNRNQIK